VLEELHVRDLALIEEAWVEFGPGLTVLTGETGAGKTVLVGALKLLLGERGDASAVRSGATEALVEGRFTVDGQERTVRRRIAAEGRSRCYLDGEMATVADLAAALGPHVDLHGQHEHQALLSPARHAEYLDRFAGAATLAARAAYEEAFVAAGEARGRLDELREALGDRERQLDYLRFQAEEIDSVGPVAGEDAELEAVLPRLRHGEKLASAASAAWRSLRSDDGATDSTGEALASLHAVEGVDPRLDEIAGEVAAALATLDDAGARLREYGDAVEYDPEVLNVTEARLAALATLKKKYGPALSDVLEARRAAEERIAALDAGEEGLAAAEAEAEAARASLVAAAAALAAARAAAVPDFTARLAEAAADLALDGATFEIALEDLPEERWTARTPQRVEFMFSPATDEPARPLSKIASGGEVSRVMLAVKGVLGAADDVEVLVFDEVDAGVGGRTALAVGRRLAQLARDHQVLVVTHLAQVAAFADAHVTVGKKTAGGRTTTTVDPVSGEVRVAEVARMLSGSDTDAGLAHARELLAEAAGTPAGRG
jgi:DNA repair protein RecN (Recombination protein N)